MAGDAPQLFSLLHLCLCCRTTCHYVPRDSSERKARREIANSNERRRMQSINAGFQSLRKMLQPRDGDKLSKVAYPASGVVGGRRDWRAIAPLLPPPLKFGLLENLLIRKIFVQKFKIWG